MPAPYPDSFYKLTKQESQIVEDRYDFIEKTAYKWFRKLNGLVEVDDLIQICAIGFIKSLKTYDKTRGYFEVYAKHLMMTEVIHYLKRNKYRFNEIYLEDLNPQIDKKYNKVYNKLTRSDENVEKTVINIVHKEEMEKYIRKILHKVKNNFSDRDIEILALYFCDGITQTDIGKKYNISRQRVWQIITKFRNIIKPKINKKILIS